MINFFKLMVSTICLSIACIASGQTLVKGTVTTGKKQNPLAEVQIEIRGTDITTTTDKSGKYAIEIPSSVSYDVTFASPLPASSANTPVLIFSLEGYEPQMVAFQGSSTLDILLSRLNSEVANNIQDPKTATAAIGILTETDLQQVVSPYFGQNLSGKIAGLQTFSTALAPGQDVALQLRAANTFANGQQPLILLDDIFLSETTLADINPDDIAYVEILKGAASAGYYGSRAANGVIRLFSKRGKGLSDGETRITYRTEYGFSRPTNQFDLNTLTNRAITNPNGPQPVLGETTPNATYEETLPNLQDYQKDALFRNGTFNTNYLALEGQSGNTNFFGSAQRMQDQGIFQQIEGYTRYAFRLNLDHQFNEKLSFNASSQFSFSNQVLPEESPNHPQGLLATTLQLTPIYDLNVPNEEDSTPFDWDIDNTGNGITNPLYRRANTAQMVDRNRILGNLTLNYQPTNWFKMSYATLLDRSNNTYEQFLEKGYLSSLRPTGFGEMATFGIDGSKGGGFFHSTQEQQTFVAHGNATIDKRLAKLRIRLGIDGWYEYLTSVFHSIGGENLAVSSIRSLDNIQSNLNAASRQSEAETFSGSFSGELNYNNKYIFRGALRIEESSLFGAKELTADYYQAGVAWRVTEDLKIKGIQDLKLRAAIGTAGIRPTFFQQFADYNLVNGAVTKNTLGNIDLQPAFSTETELGIDLTFARAFDLTFSYIQDVTEDQITFVPLSGGTGFVGQWQNVGTIESTIYEAGLNINFAKWFRAEDSGFRWNLRTNFQKYEQNVTQLQTAPYTTGAGLQGSSVFRVEVGQPFGVLYGNIFATELAQLSQQPDFNTEDFVINEAGYVVAKAALGTLEEAPILIRDENGNPITTAIGDITPDFRVGFSNSIGFKGLELYTLFDWKKGGDVYNLTKQWLYQSGRHEEVSAYPNITAPFYEILSNDIQPNNHFVEDGSFFMLREAALSFTLQQAQLKNLAGGTLQSIQLSIIGRNLWTWTNYTGFHPDVTIQGTDENTLSNRQSFGRGSDVTTPNGDNALFAVDGFAYPMRRTITLGLKVTF